MTTLLRRRTLRSRRGKPVLPRDAHLVGDEYPSPLGGGHHGVEDGDAGADGGDVDLDGGQDECDGRVPRRVARRVGRGLVACYGVQAPACYS